MSVLRNGKTYLWVEFAVLWPELSVLNSASSDSRFTFCSAQMCRSWAGCRLLCVTSTVMCTVGAVTVPIGFITALQYDSEDCNGEHTVDLVLRSFVISGRITLIFVI